MKKIVMRGNKQLKVDDSRLDDYIKAGYSEVDEKTGKVVLNESDTKADTALKKENAALKKTNKALTEQVDELNAKIAELESGGKD